MNYYYPEIGSQSKATWVLDAMSSSDKHATLIRDNTVNNSTGVFWGLAKNNYNLIKEHRAKNIPFYFTDMPYWGRWMGDNRSECYWRVIPNSLHCDWVKDYPADRFNKLNIAVKEWRTAGDHILVCPSSVTMSRFYDKPNWLNETLNELKKHTDRPIKVRHKPRGNNTSGPRAATIPFEEDLKNAWAVVTLASIAGVEAACLGIPVFTSQHSPCSQLQNLDLSQIESPRLVDREKWLNTLSYYQYTEEELKKGMGALK
jgi:hypothetical protein